MSLENQDNNSVSEQAPRKIVIASRSTISEAESQAVRDLPLLPMDFISLGVGQGSTDNRHFVQTVISQATSGEVAAVALVEEDDIRNSHFQLAKDAAAILKRTHKPVILMHGLSRVGSKGPILATIVGRGEKSRLTGCRLDHVANLPGTEVAVVTIARPFRPMFSRVAVGMHQSLNTAVREIHDDQTREAADEAMFLCEQFRSKGAKSWSIGRVGKLSTEIRDAAESSDCSLLCFFADLRDINHERRFRSVLSELIDTSDVPIMIVPPYA